jgi:hypothetical protein
MYFSDNSIQREQTNFWPNILVRFETIGCPVQTRQCEIIKNSTETKDFHGGSYSLEYSGHSTTKNYNN